MKYHPLIVTTTEALQESLRNEASVLLVDNTLLPDALPMLVNYGYLPIDPPCRTGILFRHPDIDVPQIQDPMGIL